MTAVTGVTESHSKARPIGRPLTEAEATGDTRHTVNWQASGPDDAAGQRVPPAATPRWPEHPESGQKSLSETRSGSLSFRNKVKAICTRCRAREIAVIDPDKCPPTRDSFPSSRDNCPGENRYE
ncbi:hypothetical protein GCM10009539_58590 [Cryptosporangium japonicum]|uniref:Uncharacterized protein n=1 Tax=Cryptosporangium japonicum TaxID=80872 RepID=A0ABP3EIL4_9ACTN